MKNFMSILKTNKEISFALIASVVVVLAILILTFEPFNEIPFVYNQF
ncbi:drug/metabolite transporter superfamily protein YnfA [Clostridium saccharoperbutylacetonicum]|jgi:hypothetical protein|uniref:Oligopeptide transport permease C-like N-terminal domain-containing protein n=1 Tax=Clostridium saccharoperbutylacetonicum N1-4(HMT) TaxID=931276 RepID=M1MUL0_9CLOT|nr:hypothetical protein Cspa_c46130 [Clostridium saccharoperbutylacetonicum N1-4(HMT)]NRT60856.1 drug/metabolite transporter superfamily protein YnfA [Clostridium saccharoperbutylacetonicum]